MFFPYIPDAGEGVNRGDNDGPNPMILGRFIQNPIHVFRRVTENCILIPSTIDDSL
jgi:hypothetical protein